MNLIFFYDRISDNLEKSSTVDLIVPDLSKASHNSQEIINHIEEDGNQWYSHKVDKDLVKRKTTGGCTERWSIRLAKVATDVS